MVISSTCLNNITIYCHNCKLERNIIEVLFDFCENPVKTKMSAIPQSAFITLKMKNNSEPMTVSRFKRGEEKPNTPFGNNKLLEYTPVKYNSKLMKSIWGLYNRYSPHNIKKNTDVDESGYFSSQQQQFVVAAYAISKNFNLEMKKDENIWKF